MPYRGGRVEALRPFAARSLDTGLAAFASAGADVRLRTIPTHHAALAPFARAVSAVTGRDIATHLQVFIARHAAP